MEQDELLKRMLFRQQLEKMEKAPPCSTDPYLNMNKDQLVSVVHLLLKQNEEKEKRNEEIMGKLNSIQDMLDKADARHDAGAKRTTDLIESIMELNATIKAKDKIITDLTSQLNVANKMTFGHKSQKGRKKNSKKDGDDKEGGRNNFDGTEASVSNPQAADAVPQEDTKIKRSENYILGRTGLKYKTMEAARKVLHPCDMSQVPEGAEIICKRYRSYYEQVSYIVEHDYEVVVYKLNGKFYTVYFAMEGDTYKKHVFPRTHASSNLLGSLAFDKYVISTPMHREIIRFMNDKMQVSRNTLSNWIKKGGRYLKKAMVALKELLLQEGAVVNCDETWCRVKVNRKYGKKYIWCMVNKEANVCVYFYDNGSRGRDVLREFLGDTKIAALQSDGYNAYLYLDDKLVDIEHLSCMAHARAKFKYAQEQGSDSRADKFIDLIGRLYAFEEDYKRDKLSPEKINEKRHSRETIMIMASLREYLDATIKEMKEEEDSDKSLMWKAVTYFDHYWKQLFAYRNDARYTIDNSLAERCIRPLTCERKVSMFYGSHEGADISVVYHTFVESCKLACISVKDYFVKFFESIASGRTDYENLLPTTIGLKQ